MVATVPVRLLVLLATVPKQRGLTYSLLGPALNFVPPCVLSIVLSHVLPSAGSCAHFLSRASAVGKPRMRETLPRARRQPRSSRLLLPSGHSRGIPLFIRRALTVACP